MNRFSFLYGLVACVCMLSSACTDAKETPKVSVRNIVEMRKHVGTEVTVYGRVERTNKSKSGIQFLNFQATEFSAVCTPADAAKFKDGQPADLYSGKDVELRGKLELYKKKLQMKLTDPTMIRVVEAPKPAGSKASKDFKLTKTDDETWVSPAGLVYRGRDPEGKTRVEHVLRHAKDIPDRVGSHGVFDGEGNDAFATLDEAWKLIKKRKIKPQNEGARSAYTVTMGRRVGYLGGTSGKRKRNPPLNRIFIVVRTGSNEVITAFPK